jgi:hypothetical protein
MPTVLSFELLASKDEAVSLNKYLHVNTQANSKSSPVLELFVRRDVFLVLDLCLHV